MTIAIKAAQYLALGTLWVIGVGASLVYLEGGAEIASCAAVGATIGWLAGGVTTK